MAAVSRPVALVTTFEETVLPRILAEIAAAPQPPIADWFIGTYGVNKTTAAQVAATPGCRYAPVFSIQPDTSKQARLGRRVPEEVASQLDAAHGGEIPGSSSGAVIPPADRQAWGAELGRRFRDALRAARSADIGIETWQFDEIPGLRLEQRTSRSSSAVSSSSNWRCWRWGLRFYVHLLGRV